MGGSDFARNDWEPAVGVPALVADWKAMPRRAGRIYLEDVPPRARAGLLLTVTGGCPAAAFDFAYEAALAANPGYSLGWMATARLLAREKKNH